MSGRRDYTPGWDRPHQQQYQQQQATAGSLPPTSFRMPLANRAQTAPTPAPVGSGRFGGPSISRQNSSNMLHERGPPNSAQTSFSASTVTGPPTPSSSFSHSAQSPMTEQSIPNLYYLIGKLETEVKRLGDDLAGQKLISDRLRAERDSGRREIAGLSARNQALEQQVQDARSTPSSSRFKTPETRPAMLYRAQSSVSRSSASSASVIGPSNNAQPSSFSPVDERRRMASALSTPSLLPAALRHLMISAPPTPQMQHADLFKVSIHENFKNFFWTVEMFAFQYVNSMPSGPSAETAIKALRAKCHNNGQDSICRPHDVVELLQDADLVHYLFAAIINASATHFFGSACIDGFEFNSSRELEDVKTEVDRAIHARQTRLLHGLLEHQATLYKRATRDERASTWLDGRVSAVTDELCRIILPFVPEHGRRAARTDLTAIMKTAFSIGQRMIGMPRLWAISPTPPRSRWDSHCMIQRDERLNGDPALTESNGFAFVVRLGVAPSITETGYERGVMDMETVHWKVVLLAENMHQKSTPTSARRDGGGGYGG